MTALGVFIRRHQQKERAKAWFLSLLPGRYIILRTPYHKGPSIIDRLLDSLGDEQ